MTTTPEEIIDAAIDSAIVAEWKTVQHIRGKVLAALSAAGLVIVPREADDAMTRAAVSMGEDEGYGLQEYYAAVYRAMIKAATTADQPTPQERAGEAPP